MFENLRKYWRRALVSSAVILLPMAAGLVLWNRLPDSMVVHWGADGAADGAGPKALAVFGLPLFLLAIHWFCLLVTAADPGNRGRNQKFFGLVFWIIPLLSLLTSALLYATALGLETAPETPICLFTGALFLLLGNYLPKTSQNFTMGIKLPWTLANEENWNRTHRLSGRLWVLGGAVLLVLPALPRSLFLPVFVIDLLALFFIPLFYSFFLSRRQRARGEYTPVRTTLSRRARLLYAAFVFVTLVFCAVFLFTGNITVQTGADAFTIEASYWPDLTVRYDSVARMELRQNCEAGYRTNGFGTPRLSMGAFRNEEFGSYTRYTYTRADTCIVLYGPQGQVLVLGGKNDADTRALYDRLQAALTAAAAS